MCVSLIFLSTACVSSCDFDKQCNLCGWKILTLALSSALGERTLDAQNLLMTSPNLDVSGSYLLRLVCEIMFKYVCCCGAMYNET